MPKICLSGMNSPIGYSGGRYHGWILAEALAAAGFDVTYWTNATPLVSKDFSNYLAHNRIKLHVDAFFNSPPKEHFDIGWMIPHYGQVWVFNRWMQFFMKSADRRVLLNFETPNWYRVSGQTEIDEDKWLGWRLASAGCDAIVSSLEVSSRYAKEYFNEVSADAQFLTLPPAINSLAADQVKEKNRNPLRIFMPTRMNTGTSAHKGSQYINQILTEEFRGYELALLIGGANSDSAILDDLKRRALQHGIKLHMLTRLTDEQKFSWYASAAVTVFPSSFEGYGYPPIESLYCGTPCIAFWLPNYQETCGDGITTVPQGDFAQIIRRIMEREYINSTSGFDTARSVGSFTSFVDRSQKVVNSIMRQKLNTSPPLNVLNRLSQYQPPKTLSFWLKSHIRSRTPTQATSLKRLLERLHFFG